MRELEQERDMIKEEKQEVMSQLKMVEEERDKMSQVITDQQVKLDEVCVQVCSQQETFIALVLPLGLNKFDCKHTISACSCILFQTVV